MATVKEKNDLLNDVRTKIKEIHSGIVSLSEGYESFKILFGRYRQLKSSIDGNPGKNYFAGLMSQHSSNNFCKLSAIASAENGRLKIICHAGEKELLQRINHKEIICSSGMFCASDQLSGLKLYSQIIASRYQPLFFIAAAGSAYFDRTYFEKTSRLLSIVYSDLIADIPTADIGGFHELIGKISNSSGMKIDILTIKNSSAIMLPRDTNIFINISGHIETIFKNHYPDRISSYDRISLSKFAVFKAEDSISFSNKTFTVKYNGLNIICAVNTYGNEPGERARLVKELFS